MPKQVKLPTLQEQLSEKIRELSVTNGPFLNMYELYRNDDTHLVLQRDGSTESLNISLLFPELVPVSTEPVLPFPNLCHMGCRQALDDFIVTGKIPLFFECSQDNPDRKRLRDGFLEPACYWHRIYNDVHRIPSEIPTIRKYANVKSLPVLNQSNVVKRWIPKGDVDYVK